MFKEGDRVIKINSVPGEISKDGWLGTVIRKESSFRETKWRVKFDDWSAELIPKESRLKLLQSIEKDNSVKQYINWGFNE